MKENRIPIGKKKENLEKVELSKSEFYIFIVVAIYFFSSIDLIIFLSCIQIMYLLHVSINIINKSILIFR